jgi:hypothetical protein
MALRGFGGVIRTKERYRDLCRFQSVEAFLQDAGFGLRTLRLQDYLLVDLELERT